VPSSAPLARSISERTGTSQAWRSADEPVVVAGLAVSP
jgi:hypothetical protein